ncbi:MAG: cohesin domain-containing protein [Patescibacteria group bacterium]
MRKVYLIFNILIFSLFFTLPGIAEGASLYLSPSAGNYTVGNTFTIEVRVSTGGIAANAGEGTIIFDPNSLQVVSVSKTDSVFSLWVQDPNYSNSAGTITFAGGKPSPGYTGASGVIVDIVLKATTAGEATLSFASGSVLADDGKGTNILTNLGSGSYRLIARTITPIVPTTPSEPTTSQKTPLAPKVSSFTHPDENKWYSNNNPQFDWDLPSDVTGVSVLLHEKSTGNPGPISDGKITNKNYKNIEDGTWYFHIKFANTYGWGTILHRKVLIDTENPAPFDLVYDTKEDLQNPRPVILFESQDSMSGIDYYEIAFNGEIATTSKASTKEDPFDIDPIPPGKYELSVKAVDKAGNFSLSSTNIEILPIEAPKIIKIPDEIEVGTLFTVEGEINPDYIVELFIQKDNMEPVSVEVIPTIDGRFILDYGKPLAKGDYLVWAQAKDERGAKSLPTEIYTLTVGLPTFLKFGKIAIDYLTTMLTLIVLIIGLIAIAFYAWYRVSVWRKRIRKETVEVSQAVNAAFRALKEEVEEQVSMLDNKPGLTKGEKQTRDKLQAALDTSESFIGKEIKDIEKEVD